MPRLWTSTIDAHRRAVVDAILDATGAVVASQGVTAVKMSQIAEDSGIGRATLYKYFPDVDSILVAWHERQIQQHLARLADVRDAATAPEERLQAVLEAYAHLSRHDHSETANALHQGDGARRANEQLLHFLTEIIEQDVAAGAVRTDTPPEELASFCLHALSGAKSLDSPAAISRLVSLTTSALRA